MQSAQVEYIQVLSLVRALLPKLGNNCRGCCLCAVASSFQKVLQYISYHAGRARDANRMSQTTQSQQSCGARSSPGKHPTFAEFRHQLLAEWDHTRNAAQGNYPHNINVKSIKKIHWLCGHCPGGQEHSWSAPPNDRTSRYKPGCPFCAGKAACRCNSLQALFPDMASEWDYSRNKRQPDDIPACSTDSAWWVNAKRGNWKQTIQSRTNVVQQSARPKRGQRHMPASPSQ